QAAQFARAEIDLEDGQFPGAFAGPEYEAAAWLDVERAWRFLRRRLPQRGEPAAAVDGKAGQAVMAAVRDPDELAAGVYLALGRGVRALEVGRQRRKRLHRLQPGGGFEAVGGDAAPLFVGTEGQILGGMKGQVPGTRLPCAARRLARFGELARRRVEP